MGTFPYVLVVAPVVAALAVLSAKFVLYNFGKRQPMPFNGMPSGHAAAVGALVACLAFRLPESADALGVAAVFGALYLSDLLLFYYKVKEVNTIRLGHSLPELLVGGAVGVATAVVALKLVRS